MISFSYSTPMQFGGGLELDVRCVAPKTNRLVDLKLNQHHSQAKSVHTSQHKQNLLLSIYSSNAMVGQLCEIIRTRAGTVLCWRPHDSGNPSVASVDTLVGVATLQRQAIWRALRLAALAKVSSLLNPPLVPLH